MAAGIYQRQRRNLDTIGLVSSIADAAISIDSGRKGFAIIGKEREGRISYEKGVAIALSAFNEAQVSADPETVILVEYTFIYQELQFCEETDKDTFSSLTQAIQSFDDAFLAIKIVENSTFYQVAEKTYPHNKKYRIGGFPKDSFHIACYPSKNIIRIEPINPVLVRI